jgi:tetratricopeptide (TPR) repeat protein
MTPERWQKIKQVAVEALECDSSERAEFVAQACAGDATLQREIDLLLAQDAQSIDDFAADARMQMQTEGATQLFGQRLGAYQIVNEIGRGGMGAVYLAQRADGQFDKKVAIKILKRGTDTDEVLHRFQGERQILARLEHPNIARLIDGGTTNDGLPYFVMEHVAGTPLIQYAVEQGLSIEERLHLFQEVCAAVSYAHRNLVIHRDLKPSNILITKEGEVRLLDFGIAKPVESGSDAPAVTVTMLRVMTPEYASPEQVKGDPVTTVSDVYSLGVVLYELLTGTRPYQFKRGNSEEFSKAIAEQEPTRPSTAVAKGDGSSKLQVPISKLLRGDLDNVVLKALRKEPERRYASVDQLSDDIRRHLEGLPVKARKDTFAYRAGKFVRRHKLPLAAASLFLLALIAGVVVATLEAHRARLAEAKAERRFGQVRQLAHSVVFDYHDAIADLPGSTKVRERLVKDALNYLDNLSHEAGNDVGLRRELATAYEKIGRVQGNSYYSNLGDIPGGMRSYRRSLEIREGLLTAEPNNRELRLETAASHEGVGDMHYTIGDLPAGLTSYKRALQLREQTGVSNAADQLALAQLHTRIGDISGMEGYANLGDIAGAFLHYRKAQELLEGLNSPDSEAMANQVNTLTHTAILAYASGDVPGTIERARRAIEIGSQLKAAQPNNQSYLDLILEAKNVLRYGLVDNNQVGEAIKTSQSVISDLESEIARDPKNISFHRNLAVAHNSLGRDMVLAGDAAGAIEHHRRALSICQTKLAETGEEEVKQNTAFTLQRLGEAQLAHGDHVAALENLRRALAVREPTVTADPSNVRAKEDLAVILTDTGKALAAAGNYAGGVKDLMRAISMAEALSKESPTHARRQLRVALQYFDLGQIDAHAAEADATPEPQIRARDALRRSVDLLRALKNRGALAPINESDLIKAEQALAALK